MANQHFSSYLEGSLEGRDESKEQELERLYDFSNPQVSLPIPGLNDSNQERPNEKNSEEGATDAAPIHNDSTTNIAKSKRNNAGRKKKATAEKKKQMTLTLSPDTYNKLIEWADSKPRSAPNYVSDFVEEHLSEITK